MTAAEQPIFTLAETATDFVDRLPQIPESELTILWQVGKRPPSGVMRYQGRLCWFEPREQADVFQKLIDEDGDEGVEWLHRFVLAELTQKQFEELHWRNELHHRLPLEKYYSLLKYMPRIDRSQNLVIGWFEWVSHAEAEHE